MSESKPPDTPAPITVKDVLRAVFIPSQDDTKSLAALFDISRPRRWMSWAETSVAEDGSVGRAGLVTELAAMLLERIEIGALYACGPNAMLSALAPLAQKWSLPCQFSYEAHMRCGIGVCGSCTCGDQLVCRDGPVFRM